MLRVRVLSSRLAIPTEWLQYEAEVKFMTRLVAYFKTVVQLFYFNFKQNMFFELLIQYYYTYPLFVGHMDNL
jgi:hypothetical protein